MSVTINDTPITGADAAPERSSIKFPYNNLVDAVTVAEAIHNNAGITRTRNQLAAFMNQPSTSGTFRLRLASASNFGLLKSARGDVTLTELGRNIVDPALRDSAMVQAFFNIELYSLLFEKYDGHSLPPTAALQRVIETMGVSKKQTERARQCFRRSATQAGFFKHGADRLVKPIIRNGPADSSAAVDTPTPQDDQSAHQNGNDSKSRANLGGNGGDGNPPNYHPFIRTISNRVSQGPRHRTSVRT